jgi:hypothetical protein
MKTKEYPENPACRVEASAKSGLSCPTKNIIESIPEKLENSFILRLFYCNQLKNVRSIK